MASLIYALEIIYLLMVDPLAGFYSYEMLPLEEQLEIAQQIGTTRTQIMSNLNELTLATSFL